VLTDARRLATTEGMVIAGSALAGSTAIVLTMRWLLLRALRYLRNVVARRRARRLGRAHVAFYQELQRVLKRRGHVRAPALTPREFAERMAGETENVRKALTELTEAFYRIRFGGRQLSPDEEGYLRSIIESVRLAPASPSR
jgi:hypothetical protein